MPTLARIALPRSGSTRWIVLAGFVLLGLGLAVLLAVAPMVRVAEKPAGTADEAPNGTADEEPDEETADRPEAGQELAEAGPADEAPLEPPDETPAEPPTESLSEQPTEPPSESPSKQPDRPKSQDPPAEEPAEESTEESDEESDEEPAEESFSELPPSFVDALLDPTATNEWESVLEPLGTASRLSAKDPASATFQGLVRIRGWGPDSLLRYPLADGMRIHVWGRNGGVTLRAYSEPQSLAAYRTRENPGRDGRPTPEVADGELLAADDGRAAFLRRSNPYYLNYQDGRVVVRCEYVRMLSVPLEGPVTAVYVESPDETALKGWALLRCEPPPADPPLARRVVLDGSRPADLSWQGDLPDGARLLRHDDGSVELSVEKTSRDVLASISLGGPGLRAVAFQVAEATPGAGIALLNESDAPLAGVEYVEGPDAKLVFLPGTLKQPPAFNAKLAERGPVPYAGPEQWLRLIVAAGSAQCAVSADGVHWGTVFGQRPESGFVSRIGLYLRANVDPKEPDGAPAAETSPRRIRLRRLQVRELDGLTDSVPAEWRRAAAAADVQLRPDEDVRAWTQRMAGTAPANCPPGAWRTACALHVLAGPIHARPARSLLDEVIQERWPKLPTLEARTRLLHDAALVDPSSGRDAAVQTAHWERLGRTTLETGTEAQFNRYRNARIESLCVAGLMSPALAHEAMRLMYDEQSWARWKRFEKRLNLWLRLQNSGHHGVIAARELDELLDDRIGGRGAGSSLTTVALKPVLTVPTSRAGASVCQNLLAALDEQRHEDAARLLMSSYALREKGLIPIVWQDQLVASYRVLQRILLSRPALAEAMQGRVDAVAQLRVEQILSQADPAAVEALAAEYLGTTVHAAACQWLGDRALAGAAFTEALSWYEDGLLSASAQQRPDLAARARLASAVFGPPRGEPPTQPVAFGETRMTPDHFERQIRAIGASAQPEAPSAAVRDPFPVLAASQPVRFQLASGGEFDEAGYGPLLSGYPIAVARDGLVIVSNRERAVALEAAGGKTLWSCVLGSSKSATPVRPLMHGSRVYLRMQTESGGHGIACLDRKTGALRWHYEGEDSVAGDPSLFQGRIYALTRNLRFLELDPETGNVLSERRVGVSSRSGSNDEDASDQGRFAHVDRSLADYPARWIGNRLVALVSGGVLCVDVEGGIQWVRNSFPLPEEIAPISPGRAAQPPIESDGRLYVQQPVNWVVECLEAASGELVWRQGIVGLRELLDLHDDRLLVRTDYGLTTLNAATGEILWRREVPGMLHPTARNTAGDVLCAQGGGGRVELLWLDARTGRTKGRSLLPVTTPGPVALGPMVVVGDRVWCGHGPGNADAGMWISVMEPAGPISEDTQP